MSLRIILKSTSSTVLLDLIPIDDIGLLKFGKKFRMLHFIFRFYLLIQFNSLNIQAIKVYKMQCKLKPHIKKKDIKAKA